LLNSIRIKWIATKVGIEKLVMKQGKMIGYFIATNKVIIILQKRFMKVLQFVQQHGNICKMKEKETKMVYDCY
jgi:transcription-repair coupling factor (superfamily II helicase)